MSHTALGQQLETLIDAGLSFGQALNIFAARQRRDEPELDGFIQAARLEHHRDGEVEIDDPGVIVSAGEDPGAYVLAWVWTPA